MVDKAKIKQAVELMLEAIGEDKSREGLVDTPDRIARMFEEIYAGYSDDEKVHLSKTFTIEDDGYSDIVIEKDITFYSVCEHHMMPFFGKAHIGYIPSGKVVGISKLARTVETFAKRLQIQEKLGVCIGKAIYENLGAKGVIVVLEAEHLCMSMRGIKKPGSKTVTIAKFGSFVNDNDLENKFLNLIK